MKYFPTHSCRVSPLRIVLCRLPIALTVLCACGSQYSLSFELDPDAPLVGSHAAVESLTDSAYVDYIRDGLLMIAEGHPWGERLVRLLDEQGTMTSVDQVMSSTADPPGNCFWVAVHPPQPEGLMYYFQEDPKALMLPRIPIGQEIAGLIVAHELQHAYDALMFPELTEKGTTNYVIMELNAYWLAMALADNYTDGAFSQVLLDGLENNEYKRRNKWVLIPKRSLLNRLDAFFGPPSPWEVSHRYTLFTIGLTYADCANQVERTWATYIFLRMGGVPLPPPGRELLSEHMGKDFLCSPGESIESPIEGHVIARLSDRCINSEWRGMVIEGTGPDEGKAIRILGVDPGIELNIEVQRGEVIGTAQNPRKSFKGISPHTHIEVYEEGKRTNPWKFLDERWPDRRETYPTRDGNYRSRGSKWLKKGFRFEEDRSYAEAIDCFQEALKWPWWEVASTPIYHYIARCHASLGDFEAAASTQRILVDLLEMELGYAKGGIPDIELGVIGACADPDALEIQLGHHRENLDAYERGQDTRFVY